MRKMIHTLVALCLVVLCAIAPNGAQANEGWHYVGITNTTADGVQASSWLNILEQPQVNGGHVIAWATFWDTVQSGQYCEVGLIVRPGMNASRLFYATKQHVTGVYVGPSIPFGTWVYAYATKVPGQQKCQAYWYKWNGSYPELVAERIIDVPGWTLETGIHPVKIEAYNEDRHPVLKAAFGSYYFTVGDTVTISLQQHYPYCAGPITYGYTEVNNCQ